MAEETVHPVVNLFANLPARGDDEVFTPLVTKGRVRLERIVSYGQASPPGFWYDQEEAEWVLVLQGVAEIVCADAPHAPIQLTAGDTLFLAPHRRHRVTMTCPNGPTIWLAVFWAVADECAPNDSA